MLQACCFRQSETTRLKPDVSRQREGLRLEDLRGIPRKTGSHVVWRTLRRSIGPSPFSQQRTPLLLLSSSVCELSFHSFIDQD